MKDVEGILTMNYQLAGQNIGTSTKMLQFINKKYFNLLKTLQLNMYIKTAKEACIFKLAGTIIETKFEDYFKVNRNECSFDLIL